ncbi:hypothetical protein F4677DRAFT_458856 [Hypoxylon crocopeplum]|nr:hypothetical protein F4677DRAFT_458856 [Hypoxylon crocopeplum]
MASRPPITYRARGMDISERVINGQPNQAVHSGNGMAKVDENRYESEQRHKAYVLRRESAHDLAQEERAKSVNLTADRKRQICADLRDLVNRDDSDKAFEDFRNRPEFQDAFKTEKERKAAKATRSQTASRQQSKGNILHQLVMDSQDWDLVDISKVLARIFKKPSEIKVNDSKARSNKASVGQRGLEELLEDDPGNGTPVFLALADGTNCNTRFINALLNLNPAPSNLGQVFCKRSTHHNEPYCLHATLHSETRSSFDDIKKIIDMMNNYKPIQSSKSKQRGNKSSVPKTISPFEDTNRDGDTPLHLVIRAAPVPGKHHMDQMHERNPDEPQFFEPRQAVELIEKLINTHPDTLGVKKQIGGETRLSAGRRSLGRTPYQERIFLLAEEFKRAYQSNNAEERDTRLHSPVPGMEDKQLSVRDYLFRDDFRKFVIDDPVASYISYYCIRHLPREKAMTYLYRRGEELATEFDLLGFPREAIDHTYLQRLETHVRFERTLKYVALPRLAYLASTAISSQSQVAPSLTKPADLTPIFDWLYDRHVRRIERVTVIEDRDAPHQDSTIVKCLKRFEVEIWEWEKMDISSEVISESSKSIREIRLHSSGSEAVLRGWRAPGGFGDRVKFPKLTDIHVSFHEGQEDRKTLEKYGTELTDALENGNAERSVENASQAAVLQKLTKRAIELADAVMATGDGTDPKINVAKISQLKLELERIKGQAAAIESDGQMEQTDGLAVDCIVIPRGMRGSASVSDRRSVNTGEGERIARIKELTTFFRNTVARKHEPAEGSNLEIGTIDASEKAVKIAVIDDGMDPALHIVDGKYAKVFAGSSFCTSISDSRNAYYVPLGSHGTRVASVICQICPKVDLCIARLDEQNLRAGERTISSRSAAKAIEWVTECGVDIICMSWTIEASSDDDPDLRHLQDAIKEAYRRGIIMFCSASDQGGSSNLKCYPGAWSNQDGSYCIRIGSSSSSDNASIWVNEEQVDFLLPGENILIKDSDGTSEYQTGSSYATAVAVGLAGLLLYSSLALGSGKPSSARHRGDDDDAEDNDADARGVDEDNESEDDEAGGGSSDEDSSSGRAATATDQGANVINWDGQVMYAMFKNMVYSAGRAKKMLVMPEKYIIGAIKKALKSNQGLEKLKWDGRFQAVLGNLLRELGKRTTD